MTPSSAAITAAWNVWQLNGGSSAIEKNEMSSLNAIGEIVRAAFRRMGEDGYVMCRAYEEDPPRQPNERFLQSIKVPGITRTLGVSQGYEPLHVMDAKVPMDDALTPVMVSIWQLNKNDLPLLIKGHQIQFTMFGSEHPPIMLAVTADPVGEVL